MEGEIVVIVQVVAGIAGLATGVLGWRWNKARSVEIRRLRGVLEVARQIAWNADETKGGNGVIKRRDWMAFKKTLALTSSMDTSFKAPKKKRGAK